MTCLTAVGTLLDMCLFSCGIMHVWGIRGTVRTENLSGIDVRSKTWGRLEFRRRALCAVSFLCA